MRAAAGPEGGDPIEAEEGKEGEEGAGTDPPAVIPFVPLDKLEAAAQNDGLLRAGVRLPAYVSIA
jgi:hypothetical protein